MEQTPTATSVTTKILAIIGFGATCALILFLLFKIIVDGPAMFSSLASVRKSLDEHKPITELELKLEKTVVNARESFELHWTDAKQKGTYVFGYTCTPGVTLLVRATDGSLKPMQCNDTLSVPENVTGLFLSIDSKEERFTDVPLMVSFVSETGKKLFTGNTKLTVVNAQIPVGGIAQEDTENEETPKPEVKPTEIPKPVTPVSPTPVSPSTPTTPTTPTKPVTPGKPVVTTVYPESNPNGYTDLSVAMFGSGVLKNGAFKLTSAYDADARNAIRFVVKNVGTKTSDAWSFTTKLPDGQVYESGRQAPLKPQEYVEFTLGFNVSGDDRRVDITTTISTNRDTNKNNNKAVWTVKVND